MSGVKKRVTTENPWFEIDPVSGQTILLPLNLEGMRKANRAEDLRNKNRQQKTSQLNVPTFRRNKRKSGESLETNKMFDTDPVTGEKVLLPLDLEAMRAENRINDLRNTNRQQKTSQLNVPTFRRNKRKSGESLETNKMFDTDPVTGEKVLLPLDLEAMRAENRINDLRNKNRQQKTSQLNVPTFRRNKRKSGESLETNKMFDTDPVTGEKVLLPLDLEAMRAENRINGTEEKPAKLRKLNAASNSTRKGLFLKKDVQQSNPPKRNSTVIRRNNIPKQIPKTAAVTSSPLLNMEEVEEELINKKTINKYPFKSPTHWTTKLTGPTNSKSKKKIEIPEIIIEEHKEIFNTAENNEGEPRTPDSSMEFNKLETMCVEADLESPITAVSNLMQTTGINSVKRTKLNFNANLDLKCAVNDVHQLINEEKTRHEKTMLSLNNLLTNLKKLAEGEIQNKENTRTKSTRRSVRLQIKSPLKDNAKLLTSPAFSNSGDLRKSTLKKNFVATTLVYQDPRIQKGMEMYNAMRSQNPVLETPRTERKFFAETPNSMSISMKVHNQCILLQDTPTHK